MNSNQGSYNNQKGYNNQGYPQYPQQNAYKHQNNQSNNQHYNNNYNNSYNQSNYQQNNPNYQNNYNYNNNYNPNNNYNNNHNYNYNNNYDNYDYNNGYYQDEMNQGYDNDNYYYGQANWNQGFNKNNKNKKKNKKQEVNPNNNNNNNNSFGFNQSNVSTGSIKSNLSMSAQNNNNNEGSNLVGRFGGAQKQKKRNKITEEESFSKKVQPAPKQKQPSLKQEISNQIYFPQKTQIVEYFTCPFNSNHIMQQKRALTHIQRCKKNSQNAKFFEKCPYDPCHYFPRTQIQAHKISCPKRYKYQQIQGWDIPQTSPFDTQVSRLSDDFTIVPSMHNTTQASLGQSQYDIKRRQYEQFLIGEEQSFIL